MNYRPFCTNALISNSSRLLVAPFPKSMNNFDENLINLRKAKWEIERKRKRKTWEDRGFMSSSLLYISCYTREIGKSMVHVHLNLPLFQTILTVTCANIWTHCITAVAIGLTIATHTYQHLERGELFFRKTWEITENRYFIPFFCTSTSSIAFRS